MTKIYIILALSILIALFAIGNATAFESPISPSATDDFTTRVVPTKGPTPTGTLTLTYDDTPVAPRRYRPVLPPGLVILKNE